MGFQQGGQCGSHGGGGNRDGLRSEPHLRGPCSLSEDICIAFFYIYIYIFFLHIYLFIMYLFINLFDCTSYSVRDRRSFSWHHGS